MLTEDYMRAVREGDVLRQSDLMLAIVDEAKSRRSDDANRIFAEERKEAIAFYVWQAIVRRDRLNIKQWLERLDLESRDCRLGYIVGRALLVLGDCKQAKSKICAYVESLQQKDEEALFYLGISYLALGEYENAFDAFSEAVQIRTCFAEAGANAVYAYSLLTGAPTTCYISGYERIDTALKMGRPILDADISSFCIDEENIEEVWKIPIFINSRDRVGCLMALVEWLLNAGYRNLIIIDNDSSYLPLLQYYRNIEQDARVKVVRLGKNVGHTALWDCGILEEMDIKTPYAYTDSDVLPIEGCPNNFVQELLRILRKYPSLKKAGPGLYLDDLSEKKSWGVKDWEMRFYSAPIEKEIYYGTVDTTFAVYRNIRNYVLMNAVRTKGRIQIRHIPWYYNGFDDMPEDEQYYARYANMSSNVERMAYEEKIGSGTQ